MSEYQSPLGTLSAGGQLLGDSGGGPTPPPRKPWIPVLVIALVAVVALVMVGGAAFLLLSGDDDSSSEPASTQSAPKGTEDHSEERDVRPSEPEPEEAPEEEAPIAPSERETASLLSPAGTAEALRQIRAAAKGRDALTLRVDPQSVTAIVKGSVLVYRDGKLQKLPGPPATPIKFSLDDVDSAAPSRINKLVVEKGDKVEYVVFVTNPISGDASWTVVTKKGKNYTSDTGGRRLCKLGPKC